MIVWFAKALNLIMEVSSFLSHLMKTILKIVVCWSILKSLECQNFYCLLWDKYLSFNHPKFVNRIFDSLKPNFPLILVLSVASIYLHLQCFWRKIIYLRANHLKPRISACCLWWCYLNPSILILGFFGILSESLRIPLRTSFLFVFVHIKWLACSFQSTNLLLSVENCLPVFD